MQDLILPSELVQNPYLLLAMVSRLGLFLLRFQHRTWTTAHKFEAEALDSVELREVGLEKIF